MHWQWQAGWAVREGDWKLTVSGHTGPRGGSFSEGAEKLPSVFLGCLCDDPPESANHAEVEPELVSRLTGLHAA